VHDYYQVLGIAPDASAPVVRIAFEARLKALADPASTASAAERREEERLLREAFVTLSVPAKRGPYDERLRAGEAAAAAEPPAVRGRLLAGVAAAGVAIAVFAFAVGQWRENERLRLEAARVAKEQAMQDAQRAAKARLEAASAGDAKARESEMAELRGMSGGGRSVLVAPAEEDPVIAEARREEERRAFLADQQSRERSRAQMRQFQEEIRRNSMEERMALEREKRLRRMQERR